MNDLFSPQINTFSAFAGHTDNSRMNMAAKQITQTVISLNNDLPMFIDKYYKNLSEVNSQNTEYAKEDGYVLLSGNVMIIYYPKMKKLITRFLPAYRKLVNNSISLKYKREPGKMNKGDLLYDYSGVDINTHIPKIGYRTNILFSTFFGYNCDDAMVISESFAKKATIEQSLKIYIPVTKNWKYLRNEFDNYFYKVGETVESEILLKYFLIDSGEHFLTELQNFSEEESIFFTKNIKGIKGGTINSVKVHKNTDREYPEIDKGYLYTPGIIGEIQAFEESSKKEYQKLHKVFDKLGFTKEECKKYADQNYEYFFGVKEFTKHFEKKIRDDFKIEPELVDFLLEVDMSIELHTTRGDKFTNLQAGKGVVSMIVPDEIMPKDENGKLIDMIFNPLGMPGRNNWGMVFELALAKVVSDVELYSLHKNYKEVYERISFINEYFIRKYDNDYYVDVLNILKNWENNKETFIYDINNKGFYLYVPNFPKIKYKDFFNNFIEVYSQLFNDVNVGKANITISKDFMQWLRDTWKYSGNFFNNEVYETTIQAHTGYNYMLKLYHTSDSKYTSVSFANAYSSITGQPTRGRRKQGGQHISWQTLACLLGYKENNGVLKELYTVKSDAEIKEKEQFIMKYITDGEYQLKPKYNSITKRALNNALKILGMEFDEEK